MRLNIKLTLSLSSLALNLWLVGFNFVFSSFFYDVFWPGLFLLLPFYFLLAKALTYWEVKVYNHDFYLKRLFNSEFRLNISELQSYKIRKVFFFDRIIINFKDGISYKFIGIPHGLLKEYFDGSVSNILDEIIKNNSTNNFKLS